VLVLDMCRYCPGLQVLGIPALTFRLNATDDNGARLSDWRVRDPVPHQLRHLFMYGCMQVVQDEWAAAHFFDTTFPLLDVNFMLGDEGFRFRLDGTWVQILKRVERLQKDRGFENKRSLEDLLLIRRGMGWWRTRC